METLRGTNPLIDDTDRDGLSDLVEVTGAKNKRFKSEPCDPRLVNTDGKGGSDRFEVRHGTNPAAATSRPRQGGARTS